MQANPFSAQILICINVGMDVTVHGPVHCQESSKTGRNCGGTMHKNLSCQMFERNSGGLHGDTLVSECEFQYLIFNVFCIVVLLACSPLVL